MSPKEFKEYLVMDIGAIENIKERLKWIQEVATNCDIEDVFF